MSLIPGMAALGQTVNSTIAAGKGAVAAVTGSGSNASSSAAASGPGGAGGDGGAEGAGGAGGAGGGGGAEGAGGSSAAAVEPSPPGNPARAVQQVGGAIMSVIALPTELLSTGIALATNAISSALPPFPAAQLGSMYLGIPHAHGHPPSLVFPPPIPLPDIGMVGFGTCVRVLVGGLPAARCGDLGLAPTCGGIAPFFGIDYGSSKVFIGGTRAARVGIDFCTGCTPDTAGPIRGMAAAMHAASQALAVTGIAADLIDAVEAPDPAMAAAQALAAAMNAAQMAADAVATAMTAARGTDPAIPPALPGMLATGAFTVLIAGMPLPPTPDPAQWLFNKLKGLLAKRKAGAGSGAEAGGGGGCSG